MIPSVFFQLLRQSTLFVLFFVSAALHAAGDDRASASLFLYRFNESRLEFLLGVMDYRDQSDKLALPKHTMFMTDFGGAIDAGETRYDAAVREFGEECQTDHPVDPSSIKIKAVINAKFIKHGRTNHHTLFVAPYQESWGMPRATSEIKDVCWVDGEKFLNITTPMALTGLVTPDILKFSKPENDYSNAPTLALRQDFFALVKQPELHRFLTSLSPSTLNDARRIDVTIDYVFPHLPWGWCYGVDSLRSYPIKEPSFTKPTSLAHLQAVLNMRDTTDLSVLASKYLEGFPCTQGDSFAAYKDYLIQIMGTESPELLSVYHAAPAKLGLVYLFYQAMLPYVYGIAGNDFVPVRLSPEFVMHQNIYDVMYTPGDYASRARSIISVGFGLLANFKNFSTSAPASYFFGARSHGSFDHNSLMRQILGQFGLVIPTDFDAQMDALLVKYLKAKSHIEEDETTTSGRAAASSNQTQKVERGVLWRGQYAPRDAQRLVGFSMHGNQSIHIRPDGTTPIDFEAISESPGSKELLERSVAFEGRVLGDIPSDPRTRSEVFFWPPLESHDLESLKSGLRNLASQIAALNRDRLLVLQSAKCERQYAISINTADDLMHALLILPPEVIIDHLVANAKFDSAMSQKVMWHSPADLMKYYYVDNSQLPEGEVEMSLIDAIFLRIASRKFAGGNPIEDEKFIMTLLKQFPELRNKKTAFFSMLTNSEIQKGLKDHNFLEDFALPDHAGYMIEGVHYTTLTDLFESWHLGVIPELGGLTPEQVLHELKNDSLWRIASTSPNMFKHTMDGSRMMVFFQNVYTHLHAGNPEVWKRFYQFIASLKQQTMVINRLCGQVDLEMPYVNDRTMRIDADKVLEIERFERLRALGTLENLGVLEAIFFRTIDSELEDISRYFTPGGINRFDDLKKLLNAHHKIIKDVVLNRLANDLSVDDYIDLVDFDFFDSCTDCDISAEFKYKLPQIIDTIFSKFGTSDIKTIEKSIFYLRLDSPFIDMERTITMMYELLSVFDKHGLSSTESVNALAGIIRSRDFSRRIVDGPELMTAALKLPALYWQKMIDQNVVQTDRGKKMLEFYLTNLAIDIDDRYQVFSFLSRYSGELKDFVGSHDTTIVGPLLTKLFKDPLNYDRFGNYEAVKDKIVGDQLWDAVVEGFLYIIQSQSSPDYERRLSFEIIKDHLRTEAQWDAVVEGFLYIIQSNLSHYYQRSQRKSAFEIIKDHLRTEEQRLAMIKGFLLDIKNPSLSGSERENAWFMIVDHITTDEQWALVVESFLPIIHDPSILNEDRLMYCCFIMNHIKTDADWKVVVDALIEDILSQRMEIKSLFGVYRQLIKNHITTPEQRANLIAGIRGVLSTHTEAEEYRPKLELILAELSEMA